MFVKAYLSSRALPASKYTFPLLQAVSDSMLVELKACFMEAYDDNQDGKIDIREVRTVEV